MPGGLKEAVLLFDHRIDLTPYPMVMTMCPSQYLHWLTTFPELWEIHPRA